MIFRLIRDMVEQYIALRAQFEADRETINRVRDEATRVYEAEKRKWERMW